jgi:hypothetical protein
MQIIQKPTHKSYFSKDAFLETPLFKHAVVLDMLELLTKFLYLFDSITQGSYTRPKKDSSKLVPYLVTEIKLPSFYLSVENICINESLTL